MVPRAEAAGVRARAFGRARSDLDHYSFHPLATVFGYTSSPGAGRNWPASSRPTTLTWW
jgi:hypothetical protein